jgi:Tfp pilus assembly protein PilZ
MPEEKRRFSRIVFRVAAELTVAGMSFSADHIENLSVGGCLFPLSRSFSVGTACRVVITLNGAIDGPKVTVAGEVVRSDPERVGIKFTGIDPDSLFHLHNIIRYNAPDPDRIEQEIDDHPGLV